MAMLIYGTSSDNNQDFIYYCHYSDEEFEAVKEFIIDNAPVFNVTMTGDEEYTVRNADGDSWTLSFENMCQSQWVVSNYSQIEKQAMRHMIVDMCVANLEWFNKHKNSLPKSKDIDLHTIRGAIEADVPYNNVTNEQRRIGKTINYALLYENNNEK